MESAATNAYVLEKLDAVLDKLDKLSVAVARVDQVVEANANLKLAVETLREKLHAHEIADTAEIASLKAQSRLIATIASLASAGGATAIFKMLE